jgi:hypothetical protein
MKHNYQKYLKHLYELGYKIPDYCVRYHITNHRFEIFEFLFQQEINIDQETLHLIENSGNIKLIYFLHIHHYPMKIDIQQFNIENLRLPQSSETQLPIILMTLAIKCKILYTL